MNLVSHGVTVPMQLWIEHWYVAIQLRQFTVVVKNVNNVGWSVFQAAYLWISVNLDDQALHKIVIVIQELATL